METAKVLEDEKGQSVRLPEKFRFDVDEVIVQRLGNAIILVPDNMIWETFLNGINSFSEDIFENGRDSE